MSLLHRYECLKGQEIAKLKEVDHAEPSATKVPELQLDYEFEINGLLFPLCRKSELPRS